MTNGTESILDSVKLALGIIPEYSHFDDQLIMDINSVFSTLWQLGVGPDYGFSIQDDSELWSEYLDQNKLLNLVKTFMFMSVKLMFDPPSNSFALSSMKEQIKEQEWRINVMVDPDVLGKRYVPSEDDPDDPSKLILDYEKQIINKPKIEGNELVGDKTYPELGLDEITAQDIDEIVYGN